jgi:hypothetical protein
MYESRKDIKWLGDVYIFFFIKGGTNSVILVLLVLRNVNAG